MGSLHLPQLSKWAKLGEETVMNTELKTLYDCVLQAAVKQLLNFFGEKFVTQIEKKSLFYLINI